jgi:hypothetical protein
MCRNIRTLHNFEPRADADEIEAAALQYVRKVSGTTKPSKANQEAFDHAVHEVAHRAPARRARDQCAAEEPRGRSRQGQGSVRPALRHGLTGAA